MTAVPPLAPTDEPRPHPLRSLLVAVVVFLVLLLATFGLKSYRELAAVRGREHVLIAEIAGTEQRIAELKRRIESLKTRPGDARSRGAREPRAGAARGCRDRAAGPGDRNGALAVPQL